MLKLTFSFSCKYKDINLHQWYYYQLYDDVRECFNTSQVTNTSTHPLRVYILRLKQDQDNKRMFWILLINYLNDSMFQFIIIVISLFLVHCWTQASRNVRFFTRSSVHRINFLPAACRRSSIYLNGKYPILSLPFVYFMFTVFLFPQTLVYMFLFLRIEVSMFLFPRASNWQALSRLQPLPGRSFLLLTDSESILCLMLTRFGYCGFERLGIRQFTQILVNAIFDYAVVIELLE